jgi:hypothetical protein
MLEYIESLKRKLHNGIPNVTVWRVLRKRELVSGETVLANLREG